MNVHRWRKLEATDQENYERILKIQTLQRRLIAKTEELNEKEHLIKEKERLFIELKTILSRQPGKEIHQHLQNYKDALKDKTGQLKQMMGELKSAQDQNQALKFDIDRINSELQQMKQAYFARRSGEDRANEQSRGMGGMAPYQVGMPPDGNPLSGLNFISRDTINNMMRVN
eukprot:TRINITY_DN12944_c0_g1_i2.p1 TRINITY_DN12944_c0_g1~~TRINITY_DN12944_c0_g1_i2.p1  ORF type:complete len:172 (+),score=62.49 TRINITY_DN12944_c0_g1_i2:223-738(+)